MSEVYRVCPGCGQDVAMAARHCSACGYNTEDGYPLERRNNLPEVVTKVGLPVAVGLAGLALRAGLQLLQNQLPALASNALNRSAPRQPAQPAKDGAGASSISAQNGLSGIGTVCGAPARRSIRSRSTNRGNSRRPVQRLRDRRLLTTAGLNTRR